MFILSAAWYQDTAAGAALFELRNDVSGSIGANAGQGLSLVNVTFLTQWGGFENCASTNSFVCTPSSGSASGGINLKVRAWGLKPFLSYTVKFSDIRNNSMEFPVTLRYRHYSMTALDRATYQMVTINKVDNFSLSLEENYGYWGATLPVHTWNYAAGITEIFLYEQAATEVRGTSEQLPALNASRVEISIQSDLGARPRFEILPCNFDIVKHPVAGYYMPITGCSGGCWPFEIIVKGAGFDTQSATWPDFQGNLDFTDYKCILYSGTETIFSSAVFVQDSTTIICKIGQPNSPPLVSSQLFKVNITQNRRIIGWVPAGNSTVFLADAWTGTDCSIDDICKGYAAGSNSTIRVRGFGFRRDAHYKCNFKRGSDEANSTARWLEPRLLECIVPVWNFPAGVAKFRMLKEDFGEVAFEGIGGLGAGYAHEFRFISTWWCVCAGPRSSIAYCAWPRI